jgi:hypothetical protein
VTEINTNAEVQVLCILAADTNGIFEGRAVAIGFDVGHGVGSLPVVGSLVSHLFCGVGFSGSAVVGRR